VNSPLLERLQWVLGGEVEIGIATFGTGPRAFLAVAPELKVWSALVDAILAAVCGVLFTLLGSLSLADLV
jgi:hypothetical protein